jgi:Cupin domain
VRPNFLSLSEVRRWFPPYADPTVAPTATASCCTSVDIDRKKFDAPDRTQVFLDGSERVVVEVGPHLIGRGVYRPGWRWSQHVRPLAGQDSAAHTGYVVSGRMIVRAESGNEVELAAGDVFWVRPGHDAWVAGDQPCVALDFATR